MKLVFLAGPLRGDGTVAAMQSRVQTAKKVALELAGAGIAFYSPHLNLSELLLEAAIENDAHAIAVHKEFLQRCDVLAVLPGWEESKGTIDEIKWATEKGMPIVYLGEENSIAALQALVT